MTDDDARRDVLFLLHDVARLIRVEADKRARAHGMTRAQWVILVRVEGQPGLSQKELAEVMEVEPITVARLIDRMERRGIVERRPDPKDRRVWRVHLCPPAEPLLDQLNEARTALARMITCGLDRDVIAQFSDTLLTMKASLAQEVRLNRRSATAAAADTSQPPNIAA
jgi:MarR family transcriptional regulator, transcriptional regulator for hemolysin